MNRKKLKYIQSLLHLEHNERLRASIFLSAVMHRVQYGRPRCKMQSTTFALQKYNPAYIYISGGWCFQNYPRPLNKSRQKDFLRQHCGLIQVNYRLQLLYYFSIISVLSIDKWLTPPMSLSPSR